MEVIAAVFFLVFVLLLYLYERFDFALPIVTMPLLAQRLARIKLSLPFQNQARSRKRHLVRLVRMR